MARRRRAARPIPANPNPIKPMVSGSGTELTLIVELMTPKSVTVFSEMIPFEFKPSDCANRTTCWLPWLC